MSKGSETRRRIIERAAPLFNRKGYEGCSMQDIVAAVGLEKGSLYGHFPNKEALAIAAFDHAWQQTCAARIAGVDELPGALEKLRLHVHNAVIRPSFPGGCPLGNTIIDSDDGNPGLKKEAREALKGWRLFVENIVRNGQASHEIRSDADPQEVASVLISQLEGAMLLDRFDKKAGYLKNAEKHIGMYLDTLAVQPA
ncbi:TetR/AcrR family transcriptional regulator [Silvibacterium sp.]|uniref:TetR/AcrR family transcriptional regulator n=1 Tax=Silvibacterium sp. TaxID=1964179 RepID=UPI0039E380E0